MTNWVKTKLEPSEEPMLEAMFDAIRGYTVALGGRYPKGGFELRGTGVKVKLGDRFFIATAAHVLDYSRDDTKGVQPGYDGDHLGDVKGFNKHLHSDVGYLEVEGGDNFLVAEQLGELEVDGVQYDLVGYPETDHSHTKLIAVFPDGKQMPITESGLLLAGDCIVEQVSAVLFPVGVEAVESRSKPYLPDSIGNYRYNGPHVIFDYPEIDDCQWRGLGPKNPAHRFEPGKSVVGFSGGGIWRVAFQGSPTQLWNPVHEIRLCGIQSFWSEDRQQLGAVPISEWKEMMRYETKGDAAPI